MRSSKSCRDSIVEGHDQSIFDTDLAFVENQISGKDPQEKQ